MIDEEITGVVLAIVVVIGGLAVVPTLVAGRVAEPFSELGLLGPNQKIGGYPKSLLTGEKFTLYLYVGNHEGRVAYYRVYAKLGDRASTVNENVSLDAMPFAYYDVVLLDNQTWLQPISVQVDEPGVNRRLVFELWRYRGELGSFVYDGRWTQLWINVTRPE